METDRKTDVATILVVGILVLQVILSAGLLVRINQAYRLVRENCPSTLIGGDRMDNVWPDDDPSIGPANVPVTIVAFSNYACGACREAEKVLTQVRETYADQVRIVFRDMVPGGPGYPDFDAALAAECANDQGAFGEMHNLLLENQPLFDRGSLRAYAASLGLDMEQFESCLGSEEHQAEVMRDVEDGRSYGVGATPTFFVNGQRLVGTASFSAFQRAIEEALQER